MGDPDDTGRAGLRHLEVAKRLAVNGTVRVTGHRLQDRAMAAPPPKPFAIRALNAGGAALGAAGLRVPSLDPQALCRRAVRATGLDDFGGDEFREPLGRLVSSLEDDAQLTTLGRVIAAREISGLLENRLRLTDVRRRHPEIADETVRAPVFILGLPRTGTSILHELVAQDPSVRTPLTWEVARPFPPPAPDSYESDARIGELDRHYAGIDRIIPDFKSMHRMGAQLPQECVAITQHEFASMVWHTTHEVPSYQQWLESADLTFAYRGHRRWLEYYQWAVPRDRWILKSPGHLWALESLLAVYPDAYIVQTHRDPLKVVASLVSLMCTLRSMASDSIDAHAIGRDWAARLADGLDRTTRVL